MLKKCHVHFQCSFARKKQVSRISKKNILLALLFMKKIAIQTPNLIINKQIKHNYNIIDLIRVYEYVGLE